MTLNQVATLRAMEREARTCRASIYACDEQADALAAALQVLAKVGQIGPSLVRFHQPCDEPNEWAALTERLYRDELERAFPSILARLAQAEQERDDRKAEAQQMFELRIIAALRADRAESALAVSEPKARAWDALSRRITSVRGMTSRFSGADIDRMMLTFLEIETIRHAASRADADAPVDTHDYGCPHDSDPMTRPLPQDCTCLMARVRQRLAEGLTDEVLDEVADEVRDDCHNYANRVTSMRCALLDALVPVVVKLMEEKS